MKGEISGSMIFPSTAIQCSGETGLFFSQKGVGRLWEENNSGFQILWNEGFGEKFSSRRNIRSWYS